MGTFFNTIPSATVGQSILPRNIFTTANSAIYKDVPGMFMFSGSLTRDSGQLATSGGNAGLIRPGTIIGKITATGKYRPSIIGTLAAAATSGQTTFLCSLGAAVEIKRLIALLGTQVLYIEGGVSTGAALVQNLGTITAATYGTGTQGTLTGTWAASTAVVGSVFGATDGSATPVTVYCDNPFGVDVTDMAGNSIDQQVARMLIGGDLITSQLINVTGADEFGVTVDTGVTTWVKTQLQNNGRDFTFNTDR